MGQIAQSPLVSPGRLIVSVKRLDPGSPHVTGSPKATSKWTLTKKTENNDIPCIVKRSTRAKSQTSSSEETKTVTESDSVKKTSPESQKDNSELTDNNLKTISTSKSKKPETLLGDCS